MLLLSQSSIMNIQSCNISTKNVSIIIATSLNRTPLSPYLVPFAMVIKCTEIRTYCFRAEFQSEEDDTNE